MLSFPPIRSTMITFLPVEAVLSFANKHRLNNYANIFLGTEGTSFFVRDYYGIATIPFAAVYSKDMDLITMSRQEMSVNAVLESVP